MFGELLSVRRPDTALDVGGGDDSERRRLFPFRVLPELGVGDVAALGGVRVSRRERRGGGVRDTRGEQRESREEQRASRASREEQRGAERADRSREAQEHTYVRCDCTTVRAAQSTITQR